MNAICIQVAMVQDEIYRFIKDGITSLRFEPGTRLRAAELAGLVDASRTPVREALGRLEQEGLVQRDGGWGYVVRMTTVKDILEVYATREALELLAADELLPRLTDAAVATLARINREAEALHADGRYAAFLDRNRTFHATIARLTDNRLLQQMLGMIQDRVRLIGAMLVELHAPRTQELLLSNRRIMAAIRKRDGRALRAAVRAHIRQGRDHVLRLLPLGAVAAVTSVATAGAGRSRAPRRRESRDA